MRFSQRLYGRKGSVGMSEIYEFLTGCKVFYLATTDGDKPKVRPFGFVMEYGGRLYFTTSEIKPSYMQLTNNPNLEISASNADSDWIRLSGKAVFDRRPEVKEKAFEIAPFLKEMYGAPDSPALALFYVDEGEAIISSMSGRPSKTIKL